MPEFFIAKFCHLDTPLLTCDMIIPYRYHRMSSLLRRFFEKIAVWKKEICLGYGAINNLLFRAIPACRTIIAQTKAELTLDLAKKFEKYVVGEEDK